MSGILAVVAPPGAEVTAEVMAALTAPIRHRGPHRFAQQVDGDVGLAHALVASDPITAREVMPLSLDGVVWVTADVRLDARDELMDRLGVEKGPRRDTLTDGHLLLHAYRKWGRRFPEHLLGDFSILLWDGTRQELLAVRDPFGVKLLYHAAAGEGFVAGNTLAALLRHPEVSQELNESVVGDFLLNRTSPPDATIYEALRAVPPGHTLTRTRGGDVEVTRYWDLPEEGHPPPFRDDRSTVEAFRELLGRAVSDRLRGGPVTISLSGGVDSALLAVEALEQGSPRVGAVTASFQKLLPEDEWKWARQTAQHLGIATHDRVETDPYFLDWGWIYRTRSPEPGQLFSVGYLAEFNRRAAAHAPVAFSGFDGDALLAYSRRALFWARWQKGEWRSFWQELWHHRPGSRLAPWSPLSGILARARPRRDVHPPTYPDWLNPEFEARERLRERWEEPRFPPTPDSPRGPAWSGMRSPLWRSTLEDMDPGVTGVEVEFRHPLLDLRLVDFCLSLPPLPWGSSKELLRRAIFHRVPDAVATRPKSPIRADPLVRGCSHPTFSVGRPNQVGVSAERFLRGDALSAHPSQVGNPWLFQNALILEAWLALDSQLEPHAHP